MTAPVADSLRRRLLVRLVAPLLVLLLTSAITTYLVALHITNNVFNSWLYDSVNSLALLVQNDHNHVRLNLPDAARISFEWDESDVVYYSIIGKRSGVIAGRADLELLKETGIPFQKARIVETEFQGNKTVFAILNLPSKNYGDDIRVIVGETTHKRDRQARALFLTSLLPQTLVIFLALLIIWLGVRRSLEPLQKIALKLSEQTQHNIGPIDDAGTPREVQPLTRALNDLLIRLDAAISGQRKFIADAAHQLRTPLTSLKIYLDEVLKAQDQEQIQTGLEHLQSAIDRAIRLSNQLLSLARTEPSVPLQIREFIDLCQFTRETGAEWVPHALKKKLELSFEADCERAATWADVGLLREALNNLLDNAIKYHPGDGHIVLAVKATPTPTILISDDGTGISPEDQPHIFKRFYRGDCSNTHGNGLGLSIVHEIVQAHGGTVNLAQGLNERGVSFVIHLPSAS